MILVTGGAGFIGSHTCVALANAGIPFLVLDNLCNSRPSVLERVERITGAPVPFIEGDIRDAALLRRVKSWLKSSAWSAMSSWKRCAAVCAPWSVTAS